jgi:hypothetical protein
MIDPIKLKKMKPNILITTCLTVFLLTCCKKDENLELSKSDYIIFGHFYGECAGEWCVEIFKLEQGKLFEDTEDKYPNKNAFYDGNYVQLSQQKFNDTKDLINYFPTDLLNETGTVIGQPDAGDWGGLYVEYNFDGVRQFLLLDQMERNVPTKYHNFIDKVNEKIEHLQ